MFVVNLVAGGWKALKNSSGNIRMWVFCRGSNPQQPLASGSFSHSGKEKEEKNQPGIRLSVVGLVLAVDRSQKAIYHKVRYFAAEPLACAQIKAEMLPSENAA